jgi:hypothetical protein
MQLASNTLISTEKPIYLDRLLSNGWVCVHEAMCYMGEDLVIYCGCLQMSCQQSHICQFYTLYCKCLFTNVAYASGSTCCITMVFLHQIYPLWNILKTGNTGELKWQLNRQYTYNVTLWHVHITTVAVETQQCHLFVLLGYTSLLVTT